MSATHLDIPITPLPHLPPELWLHILTHLPLTTLWTTLRPVHPIFKSEIESHFLRTHLPDFTLFKTFSLASGTRHRWYDVRATVTLGYSGVVEQERKGEREWVLFEVKGFTPPNYGERAGEKWRGLCAGGGLGRGMEWQVEFEGNVAGVRLESVLPDEGQEGRVWVDWREVVGRWMRRQEARASGGMA